ncbi:IS1634 family transposase [Raineyella sp. W15-4]|uniref:IS1634 family transposase n=1 Tax=Raineyella sp. W15-4 TaxID=3081651 RepID=UPI002952C0DE|nr:IS1634 family transposase [Raineyella sp. W15-4]WOQ15451.1 IS1634 family transposase [Raineyella sp. W15-4]
MSPFLRKVKTASGATAVQIVEKRNGQRRIVEHVGSAHDETELAVLLSAAQQRLHGLQDEALPFDPVPPGPAPSGPVVEAKASRLLWDALMGAYRHLGFDQLGDGVFAQLVAARIIEPTSKLDTIRVLGDLGLATPHRNTIGNCLRRCVERNYRGRVATACWAHVQAAGPVALVMYDLTTLHFEITDEDRLRKVGMSKEHRIDPQVSVGLLVDAGGFPLEIAMFDGAKAETKTLVPVIKAFRARHGITELVVVADAGMLSATNLNALEDVGCRFIVGSRQSRAPYDLADHFEAHGNYSPDGATIETSRAMGTGKDRRTRRVVYHYSAARRRREDRAINAQIAKAEKVAAGKRPVARDRFVTVTGDGEGKKAEVNWAVIERARASTGYKGYVTNIGADVMDAEAVVAAYHDLWHVEASFRMTKSDLAARPVFHHKKDSIEAHLTVVFAALAVSRYLQQRTGVSIKRLVQTLRPLQTVTITIAGEQVTAQPRLSSDAAAILDKIPDLTGH